MSDEKKPLKGESQIENVEKVLSRTELFIEENQNKLLAGLGIIVLVVAGFIGVRHFYSIPREKKAQVALFPAENYFAKDSLNLALNGDGIKCVGFLGVIDDYSGTDAANLAYAYAGLCYHQMGKNEDAIKYLKKFSGGDDMIAPAVLSAMGDCYSDMENFQEAVTYFEKAAKKADNNIVSPISLKKAGLAYEKLKNYDKALQTYTTIKENYSNTAEGVEMDKYIERVKALK